MNQLNQMMRMFSKGSKGYGNDREREMMMGAMGGMGSEFIEFDRNIYVDNKNEMAFKFEDDLDSDKEDK
jgi:hypothetical protein